MAMQQRIMKIVTGLFVCATFICMAHSDAMAGSKCGELLKKRCQVCHPLGKTCAELGRDKDGWKRTITAMGDYSPVITAKEKKVLVKCLAKQKKDVLELCR
jgi:hypothetical protein